jgi:hypothetical protein
MATKEVEETPPKSLRDEALEVVNEWRDELAAAYAESPNEFRGAELALVSQIIGLLEPTATHYQQ